MTKTVKTQTRSKKTPRKPSSKPLFKKWLHHGVYVASAIVLVAGLAMVIDPSAVTHAVVTGGQTGCAPTNGDCASCTNQAGCISNTSDPASTGACTSGGGQQNSCDLIKAYINPAIDLLAGCVGVVAVIALVLAGIEYVTSGGDAQKASAAKNRIAGTVVALLAFLFLYFFLEFLIPGGFLNSKG